MEVKTKQYDLATYSRLMNEKGWITFDEIVPIELIEI